MGVNIPLTHRSKRSARNMFRVENGIVLGGELPGTEFSTGVQKEKVDRNGVCGGVGPSKRKRKFRSCWQATTKITPTDS